MKVGLRVTKGLVYSRYVWIGTTLVQVVHLLAPSLRRYQPSYLFISAPLFACKFLFFFFSPYYQNVNLNLLTQNCVLRLLCHQYLERTKLPLLIPRSILREWNDI